MDFQLSSDYYLMGTEKNRRLFYTIYKPVEKTVRGTLLIIHGMQEHSGRYREIAEYFTNHGYAVLTYDHPGHGKSVEKAEDLGYFQEDQPHEMLISDAINMGHYLMSLYQHVPHYVLGHSMGSFVARCLLQRTGVKYNGAIIVGTGGSLPGIGLLKTFFTIANRFNPRRKSGFNQLFGSVNNLRFKRDKDYTRTSWLSLNLKNRISFENDELCGLPFTNNGFLGLFSLYAMATHKDWSKDIPKALPFLFLAGADDPIGDFGRGVHQSVDVLKRANFTNVALKLYSGMRHEILNETIREDVYNDIYRWIQECQESSIND